MKARKHQFHCQDCGEPCEIYKKGKGHRVLVCPNCGVLATNPIKLGKTLKKIGKGALRGIPVVGDIGAELITKEPKPQIIKEGVKKSEMTSGERALLRVLYGVR